MIRNDDFFLGEIREIDSLLENNYNPSLWITRKHSQKSIVLQKVGLEVFSKNKGANQNWLTPCFKMAGPTRLELATSGVTGRRSNQLNYDPATLFPVFNGR